MSAEMNNKYDIGNFAKLLETYSPEKEQDLIQKFLSDDTNSYLPKIRQPKFEYVEFRPSVEQLDFRNYNPQKVR